jgi:guanine nucleotide-binding protein subunit alpha
MRLAHGVSFTPWEVESYRQLVFSNITSGISQILDATEALMLDFPPMLVKDLRMVAGAPDLKDGQTFPTHYGEAISRIWAASSVQEIVRSERRLVLPDKYVCLHRGIGRLV